jgi:ABC-2 type transport system permease protein
MKHIFILTALRMRLAMRNKAFFFFSVVMPLLFLFFYATVFGRGDTSRIAFTLGQVLALTVMGSFWGLSVQLVIFREQGILRRFRLAPVTAMEMLGSSIIANYILVLPTIIVEFLIAHWVYGMKDWGNLTGAFIIVSLGAITFSALGLIVASVTNNMQETQVICNVVWMGFLFLSGATVPLQIFPKFLQAVSLFLPATYLVTGLQQVLVHNAAVSLLVPQIVALLICFVFGYFVSVQLFRWEPEERLPGRAKLWAAAAMVPFLLLGLWEYSTGGRNARFITTFPQTPAAVQPAPQQK